MIIYSINNAQSKRNAVTSARHQKKHHALIVNKRITDGIKKNPNNVITNLTRFELTDDEVEVLNFGLKHGVLSRPKESEMVATMEYVWEQIDNNNILKENHMNKQRVQTALRAFTYNYLDLETKDYQLDRKRINIIQDLREKVMILKPDKGQGIVLVNKDDYIRNIECLFSDKTKFQVLDKDPTLQSLNTVQNYLNTLFNRGEISNDEKKSMRPKFAQIGRAHGLPKTHKKFENLPPFRPIVDTTNTPYYGIAKFLANLLNPLTLNDFTVKDSFDAANKIQQIPKELFDSGYKFVSFDVISLFTNVPLAKTIDIILKCVYSENLVTTNLTKRLIKKLLKDACSETVFTFNDKIYKQIDGASTVLLKLIDKKF